MKKRFLSLSLFLLTSVVLVSCIKTERQDPITTPVVADIIEEEEIIIIEDNENSLDLELEVDIDQSEELTETEIESDLVDEEIEDETTTTEIKQEITKPDKEIKVEISVPETDEIIEVENIVDKNLQTEEIIETTQNNEHVHEDNIITTEDSNIVEVEEVEPNIEVLEAYLNVDSTDNDYTLNYNLTGNIDIESHVFDQVNELRTSLGIFPLTSNDILVGAAYTRSKELPDLFSHTRPDGREWSSIFDEIPYRFRACGENLTTGTGLTREQAYNKIFESWYNSPGHYANMVNPDFKEIGIAVYFEPDGTYYATQMFGAQFS